MSLRDELNASRPVSPSKCECKGTGVIKASKGHEVYCHKHPHLARRKWPRLTKDGGTEFLWLDTEEVVGQERKKGQPRVEYVIRPECSHEFEVYGHGEVKCRKCKKRYPTAWALDRIAKDEAGVW